MSKVVELEEILLKFRPTIYNYPEQKSAGLLAMKEACKQTLKLASENAISSYIACGWQYKDGTNIDKKSILNTIDQIK